MSASKQRPLPFGNDDDPDWLKVPVSRIEKAFAVFHRVNPGVYGTIERLALELVDKKRKKKAGMGMIFEVMRYQWWIATDTSDEFKLNNNYRALYARLLLYRNPRLADVIEIRERKEVNASTDHEEE